jgi:Ras-related protein Rab-18
MAATAKPVIKLLILGDSGVGKSSLMNRFACDQFDEAIASTIGCDFRSAPVTVDDASVMLHIWDTAGQEQFRALSSSFYRGAHAALFVYDVSNSASFDHLPRWMTEALAHAPDLVTMLVANKIDLTQSDAGAAAATAADLAWRGQERARALDFAREHGMLSVRCSAKTREGVSHAFDEVVRRVVAAPDFQRALRGGGGGGGGAGDASGRIDLNAARSATAGGGGSGGAALGGCC